MVGWGADIVNRSHWQLTPPAGLTGMTAIAAGSGISLALVSSLVGSPQLQPYVDSNPAGMAEAFRYTAAADGTATRLSVYLDSASIATRVIVGLYTNTPAGDPGTLLTSGTITNPVAGSWNTVTVPGTSLRAGTDYWLALLTPLLAGTIKFRDLADGAGGPTQTSAQKSLTSGAGLPRSWKTGTRYANSPASVYVTAG